MLGREGAPITIIHYQAAASAQSPSWLRLLKEAYPQVQSFRQRQKVRAALSAHPRAVLIVDYGAEEETLDAVELAGFHELAPALRPFAIVDPALSHSPRLLDLLQRRLIHDFSLLPLDSRAFLGEIERLCRLVGLEDGAPRQGRAIPPSEKARDSAPIGSDSKFLRALASLRRAATTGLPVLVTGESGTGKELAARLVHENSAYRTGPLLAVNCAGLAPNLIASELFGHEKGAFTDAKEQKIGRIEAASGGTLFLDEIGDLPLELQGFLLRFLEEKTIERVGGTKRLVIDTRIVAATNADLDLSIAGGRFRKDLFYRLNVLAVQLPPLRERGGDAVMLAGHFLERFRSEFERPHIRLGQDALDAIARHDWPGNVRELIAVLRRAVLMADQNTIGAEDLHLPSQRIGTSIITLQECVAKAERAAVETALHKNRGNVNRTSRELGVSRVTLYRLLEKHAIAPARQRNGFSHEGSTLLPH